MAYTIKIWLDRIIRSKTMWLAALLAVLGAIQASTEALSTFLSPSAAGMVTVVVSALVALLRVVTTQPLRDK